MSIVNLGHTSPHPISPAYKRREKEKNITKIISGLMVYLKRHNTIFSFLSGEFLFMYPLVLIHSKYVAFVCINMRVYQY